MDSVHCHVWDSPRHDRVDEEESQADVSTETLQNILTMGKLYPKYTKEQNLTQRAHWVFGVQRLLYLTRTISENSHSHT